MSEKKEKKENETELIGAMSSERIEQSEILFDELTGVMNEIHGMNASRRFWFMVLEMHVRSMVSRKHLIEHGVDDESPTKFPMNQYHHPITTEMWKSQAKQFIKHLKSRANREKVATLLKQHDVFAIG